MPRNAVFLVRQGRYGTMNVARGDYDQWIGIVQRLFEETPNVLVVQTANTDEAIKQIKDGPGMENAAIIFFTRGMFPMARLLKQQNPALSVVVLTVDSSKLPGGEVLIIDKTDFDFDQDEVKEQIRKKVLA